jgi:hypothetical protein
VQEGRPVHAVYLDRIELRNEAFGVQRVLPGTWEGTPFEGQDQYGDVAPLGHLQQTFQLGVGDLGATETHAESGLMDERDIGNGLLPCDHLLAFGAVRQPECDLVLGEPGDNDAEDCRCVLGGLQQAGDVHGVRDPHAYGT